MTAQPNINRPEDIEASYARIDELLSGIKDASNKAFQEQRKAQFWELKHKKLNSVLNDILNALTNSMIDLDQANNDLKNMAHEIDSLKNKLSEKEKHEEKQP